MHQLEPRQPRYETEILIPSDRYVCLQLPDGMPEGPATVTIVFHPQPVPAESAPATEPDRDDIEWWEEFEDDGVDAD